MHLPNDWNSPAVNVKGHHFRLFPLIRMLREPRIPPDLECLEEPRMPRIDSDSVTRVTPLRRFSRRKSEHWGIWRRGQVFNAPSLR